MKLIDTFLPYFDGTTAGIYKITPIILKLGTDNPEVLDFPGVMDAYLAKNEDPKVTILAKIILDNFPPRLIDTGYLLTCFTKSHQKLRIIAGNLAKKMPADDFPLDRLWQLVATSAHDYDETPQYAIAILSRMSTAKFTYQDLESRLVHTSHSMISVAFELIVKHFPENLTAELVRRLAFENRGQVRYPARKFLVDHPEMTDFEDLLRLAFKNDDDETATTASHRLMAEFPDKLDATSLLKMAENNEIPDIHEPAFKLLLERFPNSLTPELIFSYITGNSEDDKPLVELLRRLKLEPSFTEELLKRCYGTPYTTTIAYTLILEKAPEALTLDYLLHGQTLSDEPLQEQTRTLALALPDSDLDIKTLMQVIDPRHPHLEKDLAITLLKRKLQILPQGELLELIGTGNTEVTSYASTIYSKRFLGGQPVDYTREFCRLYFPKT